MPVSCTNIVICLQAMSGKESGHSDSAAWDRRAFIYSLPSVFVSLSLLTLTPLQPSLLSPLDSCAATGEHQWGSWGGRQWIKTTGQAWCVFLSGSFPIILPWPTWQSAHSASLLTDILLGTSYLPDTVLGTGNPEVMETDQTPALMKFLHT